MSNQLLGERGEKLVAKNCYCFKCKRSNTLKRLPPNFKCADIVCDFCGYLAQVKTITASNIDTPPSSLRGAAWNVLEERLNAGIYFPLFIVLVNGGENSIFYLSSDLQKREIFVPRTPSLIGGTRVWQGVNYDFRTVRDHFIRVL